MNRTIRRTSTRSKSSSLPLDEASLLLADEPNANSQTDRSYYLNERNGLFATVEIRAALDRWTLTDYRVLNLFVCAQSRIGYPI